MNLDDTERELMTRQEWMSWMDDAGEGLLVLALIVAAAALAAEAYQALQTGHRFGPIAGLVLVLRVVRHAWAIVRRELLEVEP